ncbi:ABC transporter substrate-binding protein [Streptomyces sp. CC208A]|uniref:ABC transporter substrate-binding protein n=1 Tax=Streptomyces sp. CC208A TaxID=3044573 RepID=UPI0024A8D2E0|nr:ABC transporter substrate-binding protein [Streptomyces sp. CC208A]
MPPPRRISRRSLHRAFAATAFATATAVLASGCFAGPATGPAAGTAKDGSARDGRVRVAMMQPPRSGLSPLSDDAFKLSRWSTAETLIRLDANGDAVPSLATAWHRSGRTWTLTLRDGVTFHDGTPLTAEAAARSLTAAAQASPKPRILDGVTLTAHATGPRTLTVTTADTDPLLPQRLSSPQLSILAAKAYRDGRVNPVGAGTGPFVLVRADGTASATLDRYDGYWGDRAKAAGIDVRYVPDGTARAAALRSGEADIVEAVPVSQASLLDPERIAEVAMPRTNTLYLNTSRGPFKDPALRAAARTAVDARALVAGVYEGRADLATGLLGPALPWAAKLREPIRKTAGATVPPGTTLTLGTFTDRAELPEVAQLLQQQLQKAGFTVRLDIREYAMIEADALAGKFDAFVLSRATVLDSGDPAAYLYSDFAADGSFNIAQLADPAVDRALDKAAAIAPGEARRRALIDAEAAVLASDAAVPLLHERVIQGEAPGVVGAARDPRERELVTAATHVR